MQMEAYAIEAYAEGRKDEREDRSDASGDKLEQDLLAADEVLTAALAFLAADEACHPSCPDSDKTQAFLDRSADLLAAARAYRDQLGERA